MTLLPGTRVEFGTHGKGTVIARDSLTIPEAHRPTATHPTNPEAVYVAYDEATSRSYSSYGRGEATGGWFAPENLRPIVDL